MSTIIILIGAAVLGLLIAGNAVMLRRTHRELREARREWRHTHRELREVRQELQLQGILRDGDGDDGPPKRRRHLRALALLAPLLLWIHKHPVPASAIGAAAVGTVAVAAIIVSIEPETRPSPGATSPMVQPPSSTIVTTAPRVPTTTTTGSPSPADRSSEPVVRTRSRPAATGTTTSGVPTPTATTPTPREPPIDDPGLPPGSGLCVIVDLPPLLDVDLCVGALG